MRCTVTACFLFLAIVGDGMGAEPLAGSAARGWQDEGYLAQLGRRTRPSLLSRLLGEKDSQAQQDWEATLRCRDKIATDPDLAKLNLDVSVNHAIATISGHVPTTDLKIRAEELAKQVKGVKSVQNRLRVDGAPMPSTAPRGREFMPLDQMPKIEAPEPARKPKGYETEPPRPPQSGKLMGEGRQWVPDSGPKIPTLSAPVAEPPQDPREALSGLLRDNKRWHGVRYRVEDDQLFLIGNVGSRRDHDELIERVYAMVGWRIRDQINFP